MKKTYNYLASTAFAPGEFERLQALHDRQQLWLADQLEAAMRLAVLALELTDELRAFEQQLPADGKFAGRPLSDADLQDLLDESAQEEAFLLAGQALHHWNWFSRELPQDTLPERARRVTADSLQQQGWEQTPVLYVAVVEALRQGIPLELQ